MLKIIKELGRRSELLFLPSKMKLTDYYVGLAMTTK